MNKNIDNIKYFCDNKNFKFKKPQHIENINEEFDLVTCGTYLKKKNKSKKWSKADTEKFYLALTICGCDFSLMEKIFTERSRKNIKDKFLNERKINSKLISDLLKQHHGFDKAKFDSLLDNNK